MNARWNKAMVAALAAGGILIPGPARAEEGGTLQERFERLEQRYNILERKVENDQEAAATKAKDAQSVTANGADGFQFRNADKSFALRIGGYVQADGRFYLADDAKTQTNNFLIRRSRLDFRGTAYKFVDFRIQAANDNNTAALLDAYVNLKFSPVFQVLAGQTKVPFGLERLQANNQSTFVEGAYTTLLTPNYDVGLQVAGGLKDGAVTWTVAHLNGVADNASASSAGDETDSKGWAARVFLLPFKSGGSLAWKDLGFGVAAASEKLVLPSSVTSAGTGLPGALRTPGQGSTVFSYSSSHLDGKRVRWSPQAYWYPGRTGFLAEYVVSRADVRRAGARTPLTNRAWQVNASYSLTGESTSYRGIKPLRPYEVGKPGWGAFEVAARYTELRIDPATFPTFVSPASQAERARTWTGGINWHLNTAAKVQLEYDYTRFTGGVAAGQVRKPARELLTRFQASF
jgi:phosphate-selective porin OprO and OprP